MNQALQEAINLAGTQESFAEGIGRSQSMVSYWLHHAKKGVPPEDCIVIESKFGFPKERLRPDVFCSGRPKPSRSAKGVG